MSGEVRIVLGGIFIVMALAVSLIFFLAFYLVTVGFLILAWGIDAYTARDRFERRRLLEEPAYYPRYPAPSIPPAASPPAVEAVSPPSAPPACGGCGGPTWFTPRTGRGFCERCAFYS